VRALCKLFVAGKNPKLSVKFSGVQLVDTRDRSGVLSAPQNWIAPKIMGCVCLRQSTRVSWLMGSKHVKPPQRRLPAFSVILARFRSDVSIPTPMRSVVALDAACRLSPETQSREAECTCEHAVMQDAAYGTLLRI
jgi:hypothetical protein